MDDHNLILAVAGVVSALGLKEIWTILKTKLHLNAKKEERADHLQYKVIEELKNKILIHKMVTLVKVDWVLIE